MHEMIYQMIPYLMILTSEMICSIFLERGISILQGKKFSWKRSFAFFCIITASVPIMKSILNR
ncbi:MAG: hypothetical protein COT84_05645 [Chlamydiae bacterium CG10_big_fil_rev_8_21_14_0_10_35_9]|jgi:hypothetical protein|nr:MAG: hypothetical protein COT84_05645 [Chlamydiae bacterium CG10_big_fil_rev_8_21_14_0_10_35_9]